jgi:Na+-driven multidrug efflux pump
LRAAMAAMAAARAVMLLIVVGFLGLGTEKTPRFARRRGRKPLNQRKAQTMPNLR